MGLLKRLRRFRFSAFDRSDQLPSRERTVENDDAGAHTINPNPMAGGPAQFPPNYVRPADEGRPRH
jgi:hypothetical protein